MTCNIEHALNSAYDAWTHKHGFEPNSFWISPRTRSLLEMQVRGSVTLAEQQVILDSKFRGAHLRTNYADDRILVGVAEEWPNDQALAGQKETL